MTYVIAALAIIAIYTWQLYNSLITTKNHLKASIQEIGNQLKRQADLIPNLIKSVKGYMKQEKGIYKMITDARKLITAAVKSNDLDKIETAQKALQDSLGSIRVVLESNPELKSNEVVSNLMDELRDTSDKVMYARRTLIDLSADYNIKISTIPNVWIAKLFGFKPEKGLGTPTSGEHLEVSASDTKAPKVDL